MKRIVSIGVLILLPTVVFGALAWRHARSIWRSNPGGSVGATLLVAFRPWHASGADKGTMECLCL